MNSKINIIASNTSWIESKAIDQLEALARLKGVKAVIGLPDLHPGRGPAECERATSLFLNKYLLPLIEAEGYTYTLLSKIAGDQSRSFKSILLHLSNPQDKGRYIYPLDGTIKWICQSPFRLKHKRKNWFINVSIF